MPSAELLVVTTPQLAAREVAERAGSIALQTHQQIVGVVENMSWLDLPDGTRMELFGAGGGQSVADSLAASTGTRVPLLGQVPIDQQVREGGDAGAPVVLSRARVARPRSPCGRWPTPSRPGSAAWSAARWGSPRPVADRAEGLRSRRRRSGRRGAAGGAAAPRPGGTRA